MIWLIAGRAASGKDSLAQAMRRHGVPQILSSTTRPRRSPSEDRHVFVTAEESAAEPAKLARTIVNGHEYYFPMGDVCDGSSLVVDMSGVRDVSGGMPDAEFVLAYVVADEGARRGAFVSRESDAAAAEGLFLGRDASERGQFDEFESLLRAAGSAQPAGADIGLGANVREVAVVWNDYEPGTLDSAAVGLVAGRYRNERHI